MVSTEIFRVAPSRFVGEYMLTFLYRWGWILVIPLGVCGCLAVNRWEWLVVGLILLLIIYPFVLATVYFRYGLSEEASMFIRPMRVEISRDGVCLHLMRKDESQEVRKEESQEIRKDKSEEVRKDESEEAAEITYVPEGVRCFSHAEVKKVSSTAKELVITLKSSQSIVIDNHAWGQEPESTSKKSEAIEIFRKNGIEIVQ